jgi:hypothetical protein
MIYDNTSFIKLGSPFDQYVSIRWVKYWLLNKRLNRRMCCVL